MKLVVKFGFIFLARLHRAWFHILREILTLILAERASLRSPIGCDEALFSLRVIQNTDPLHIVVISCLKEVLGPNDIHERELK